MNRTALSSAGLGLLVALACDRGDPASAPAFFSEGAGAREVRSSQYDTLWTYGGLQDTVLVAPNTLLATADGIYVLDVSTQRVVKLTWEGAVAWTYGRRGQGPGELLRARAMSETADGVVVADTDNQKLLWMDRSGRLQREARIGANAELALGSIEGIATLASGYVLETTRALWPFIQETGEHSHGAEAPWPRVSEMPYLQRIGLITGIDGDRWAFSFVYGNGWIVFDNDRVASAYPLVEHSEFPRIVVERRRDGLARITSTRYESRPRTGVFDMKTAGDTLLILSSASGHGRLVDKYDTRSGRYLYSRTLPAVAGKMDVFEDRLVTIDNTGLAPLVQAFQLKEELP